MVLDENDEWSQQPVARPYGQVIRKKNGAYSGLKLRGASCTCGVLGGKNRFIVVYLKFQVLRFDYTIKSGAKVISLFNLPNL